MTADRSRTAPAPHIHVHDENCVHDHDHDAHAHRDHHHGPVEPYVRGGPKVGRNDPCPCGSGKKHKKCCLPAV